MENQLNEEVITQHDANNNKPEFLNKPEEEWTTDDAIEAKKYAQTLYAQKEHWRTKATTPKEETPKAEEQNNFNNNNNGNTDSPKLEKLELKIDGYSDEEIEFIQQIGGKKSLENPYVKQTIDNMREKKRAEEAVISDSGSKSDIEKKYSDSELRNMPIEELEKILPKA